MAKAPPSFDFYPNDWIGGTAHLTLVEQACYLKLLMFQWSNGHLPIDPAERMHLCGLPECTWRTVWGRIKDKFEPKELEDEFVVLVNARMDEDREKAVENWLFYKANSKAKPSAEELSKIRSDAGKQGGRPKGTKSKIKQTKAKQSKWEGGRGKGTSLRSKKDCQDFDRFWEAYPRKVAKVAARKAWGNITAPVDAVMDAVRAYAASKQGNGDFCPYPASWLNQGRWEDDRATWEQGGDRSGEQLVDISDWDLSPEGDK